ncbi:efflux transporter, RND family, MFP subunit, partial [Candidatus Thiomargarita nelsonii]
MITTLRLAKYLNMENNMTIHCSSAELRLAKYLSPILAVALTLAGCSQQSAPPPPPPPPQVTVATPLVKAVTDWDEYTGRLASVKSVEIRARVSGYLESVHFRDGAIVKKGKLLFVIDPRPYQAVLDEQQAALNQAQVRLDLTKKELTRAQRLFKS